MPIKIEYSSIGSLDLTVPWKYLASSPVEVILEDVFLIVKPTGKHTWTAEDFDKFEVKKLAIESYAATLLQNFKDRAKTQQQKEEEAGYFSRLTTKIIDNL